MIQKCINNQVLGRIFRPYWTVKWGFKGVGICDKFPETFRRTLSWEISEYSMLEPFHGNYGSLLDNWKCGFKLNELYHNQT